MTTYFFPSDNFQNHSLSNIKLLEFLLNAIYHIHSTCRLQSFCHNPNLLLDTFSRIQL